MSMNLYKPDTDELLPVAGNGTVVIPMPVGTVVHFAGDKIPDGWLLCDGSEYSKLEYPALYAVIKDKWGTASNDTFKVPDFIGRFAEGSVEVGEYKEAGLPNLVGYLGGYLENLYGDDKLFKAGVPQSLKMGGGYGRDTNTRLNFNASLMNGIYGKSDTVQPNSALVKFIICAVQMDVAGNPEPKYSIGQVSHFLFQPDDPHWLLCDGSTVDVDLHPVLASKMPVLPDLRECVLVGAGQNENLAIASHDVYSVGEFKDDQLQGHEHKILGCWDNGSKPGQPTYSAVGNQYSSNTSNIVSDGINGTPRVGTTTHGKQYGVGIYVYAD